MLRGSKTRILGAAREEFARRGYAGARTKRIAELAHVNKQLLFYYFGSKQGLYEAVLSEAGEAFGATATGGAPASGPDGIRKQLSNALERTFVNPELGLIIARGARTPDGIEAVRRVAGSLVNEVRSAILAGQGIGYFRDDADPDLTAEQAVVLVLGYLAFEPALGSGSEDRRRVWLDGTVELLVRGVTW